MKKIDIYTNIILVLFVACSAPKLTRGTFENTKKDKKPLLSNQIKINTEKKDIEIEKNNSEDNFEYQLEGETTSKSPDIYRNIIDINEDIDQQNQNLIQSDTPDEEKYITYLYMDEILEEFKVLKANLSSDLLRIIKKMELERKRYYRVSEHNYGKAEFRALYDEKFRRIHAYLFKANNNSNECKHKSTKITEFEEIEVDKHKISLGILYKINNKEMIKNLSPDYLDKSAPSMYQSYLSAQKFKNKGIDKCLQIFSTLLVLGHISIEIFAITTHSWVFIFLYSFFGNTFIPFICLLCYDPLGYKIINNAKEVGKFALEEPSSYKKKICCMKKINNNVKGTYSCCLGKLRYPESYIHFKDKCEKKLIAFLVKPIECVRMPIVLLATCIRNSIYGKTEKKILIIEKEPNNEIELIVGEKD